MFKFFDIFRRLWPRRRPPAHENPNAGGSKVHVTAPAQPAMSTPAPPISIQPPASSPPASQPVDDARNIEPSDSKAEGETQGSASSSLAQDDPQQASQDISVHTDDAPAVDVRKKDENRWALLEGSARLVFKAAEAVSKAFPPLDAAMSGVKVLVEVADKHTENKKALESLSQSFTTICRLLEGKSTTSDECRIRDDLKETLGTVGERISRMEQQGKFANVVQIEANESEIKECLFEIDQALRTYELSLLKATYEAADQQLKKLNTIYGMSTERKADADANILDKIPFADDAEYRNGPDRPLCLKDTRVGILEDLQQWADNPNGEQVCWLRGYAGSGKSTIAQSLAKWLAERQHEPVSKPALILGGSFFCSRKSPGRRDVTKIIPSLSRQLADRKWSAFVHYREKLLEEIRGDESIKTSKDISIQLKHLLVTPAAKSKLSAIILIDSLDECEDRRLITSFLSALTNKLAEIPNIKIFITSRWENHIQEGLHGLTSNKPNGTSAMKIVNLDDMLHTTAVQRDIRLYIETELRSLATRFREDSSYDIPEDWPSSDKIEGLASKSGRLFIFASIAVSAIADSAYNPIKRLDTFLGQLDSGSTSRDDPYHDLSQLYLRILEDAFPAEKQTARSDVRSILGLLVVAREPMCCTTIANLLDSDISPSDVYRVLRFLRSVVSFPAPVDCPHHTSIGVEFHHKSFVDFLTAKVPHPGQNPASEFSIDPSEEHYKLAHACFKLMNDTNKLSKNVYGLKRYSLNNALTAKQKDTCTNGEVRYCSRYWADHLREGESWREFDLRSAKVSLGLFMTKQHLRWFEVLGALGELHKAVDSLRSVREWLLQKDGDAGGESSELTTWMADGERFILVAGDVIQESVPHTYHSALPWVPHAVSYRGLVSGDLAKEAQVVLGATTHWTGNIRTIQTPEQVYTLEYSHQGTLLAAGGANGFCKLIHASTSGKEYLLNTGDDDGVDVFALAFRPDDCVLATARGNRIHLWDVNTHRDTPLVELTGHSEGNDIKKITFHPENIHLLLSMDDADMICLWNTGPGLDYTAESSMPASSFRIKDASSWGALCWIPYSSEHQKVIAVGTKAGHIELYDVTHNTTGGVQTLDHRPLMLATLKCAEYEYHSVDAVTVTNDGAYIAGGSDYSIVVYDTKSKAVIYSVATAATSKGIAWMYSLMFSPKFKNNTDDFLAFTRGNEVGLYYPQRKGDKVVPFSGHGARVSSVTFSPDGQLIATSSWDGTIRLWGMNEQVLTPGSDGHHTARIKCTHFSLDGNFVVSGSLDKTVRVWSVVDRTLCQVLKGHKSYVLDAIILFDNRFVVSREDSDETLIVWKRDADQPIICQNTTIYQEHGNFKSNFPFTAAHGSLGFFSTHTKWNSEAGCELWKICCWELVLDSGASDNGSKLRLMAQGPLPPACGNDVVVRVYQSPTQPPTTDDTFTVMVDCASGRRYRTTWTASRTEPHPENLEFEEAESSTTEYAVTEPLVGQEEYCLQSDDKAWVLLNKDTKILWVPPAHRGAGRWWKAKEKEKERLMLLLEGESGRLSLLDFTGVSLDDRAQL